RTINSPTSLKILPLVQSSPKDVLFFAQRTKSTGLSRNRLDRGERLRYQRHRAESRIGIEDGAMDDDLVHLCALDERVEPLCHILRAAEGAAPQHLAQHGTDRRVEAIAV